MRKILDKHNSLEYINFYPSLCFKSKKHNLALIGVGGNIKNTKRRFKKLFLYLKKFSKIDIIKTSPILKNPPFGYKEQPYFYNAVIKIKTNLTPHELLRCLQHIEKIFGRKRTFKDAPRTLDLDIIFFNNINIKSKKLTIPHHGWKKRTSVIVPLSRI